MKILNWIFLILLVVGGLNWGLVSLLDFNLVTTIFGEATTLTQVIYILVGLSGVYAIFLLPKLNKACNC